MNFIKSKHLSTLRNEHLEELISADFPDFGNIFSRFFDTSKSNKKLILMKNAVAVVHTLKDIKQKDFLPARCQS